MKDLIRSIHWKLSRVEIMRSLYIFFAFTCSKWQLLQYSQPKSVHLVSGTHSLWLHRALSLGCWWWLALNIHWVYIDVPYVRVSPDTSSFSAPVRAAFQKCPVFVRVLTSPFQVNGKFGFCPDFERWSQIDWPVDTLLLTFPCYELFCSVNKTRARAIFSSLIR